jgi:NAD(P)H-nitrite reductase large subunit
VVLNAMPLPEHPEELILPLRDGAARAGRRHAADAALICSCNTSRKGRSARRSQAAAALAR